MICFTAWRWSIIPKPVRKPASSFGWFWSSVFVILGWLSLRRHCRDLISGWWAYSCLIHLWRLFLCSNMILLVFHWLGSSSVCRILLNISVSGFCSCSSPILRYSLCMWSSPGVLPFLSSSIAILTSLCSIGGTSIVSLFGWLLLSLWAAGFMLVVYSALYYYTWDKIAVKAINKQAKAIKLTGKFMTSVFWDAERVLLIDDLSTD